MTKLNAAQEYFADAVAKRNVRKYEKFGNFLAVKAEPGVKVDTIIDGVLETTNIAKAGDWLLTGISGEQYLIGDAKFKQRYMFVSKTPKGDKYRAIGDVYAIEYKGLDFTFKAPWGEDMICSRGDMICSTSLDNFDDVYRIEKKAFAKTYRRV